jgi:hypothetical protein
VQSFTREEGHDTHVEAFVSIFFCIVAKRQAMIAAGLKTKSVEKAERTNSVAATPMWTFPQSGNTPQHYCPLSVARAIA